MFGRHRSLLLVALIASINNGLVLGGKFIDEVVLGDESAESEDELEERVLVILGTVGPIGLMLIAVALYCGRHSIKRWWNARKPTTTEVQAIDVGEPETWPFALVDAEKAVCKPHKEQLCTCGCRVDYSLLNQIRHLPDSVLKGRKTRAKLATVQAKIEGYVLQAQESKDKCTGTGSNLTISTQDSARLLLKDAEPCRMINGFASICYALLSEPESSKNKVNKNCCRLAIKASQMVETLAATIPSTTSSSDGQDRTVIQPGDEELASQTPPWQAEMEPPV